MNVIIYIIGGIVASGGNILLAPIYLRLLSSEDYGEWSKFLLMIQFLQPIMCWGLLATMTRILADSYGEARPRIIGAAIKMSSALNAGLLLLIILSANLDAFLFIGTDHRWDLLIFAAIQAALMVYPVILMGIYVVDGKALQYRGVSIIGFLFQAAALMAITLLPIINTKTAVVAMILGSSAYAIVTIFQLLTRSKWNGSQPEYKELLLFGIPIVFYTVTGQLGDLATRYLLSINVSKPQFGAFSAGMIYASIVAMISSAINLAWVPIFYRNAKEWMFSGIYRQFADILVAASTICSTFLIIFCSELFSLYSNGNVNINKSMIGYFIITAWINSAVWTGFVNPLFQLKKTKTVLFISLGTSTVVIPPAFYFIPKYGLVGATLVIMCNAALMCLLASLILKKNGIHGLSYGKIGGQLALLGILSSPILECLASEQHGLSILLQKVFVFIFVSALIVLMHIRDGLKTLAIVESRG